MDLLFTAFYIFILSLTLALMEIQIEGKNGWARELPTWRANPNSRIFRIFSMIMPGKDLTGYHMLFFILIIIIFHFPYVQGVPFTLLNWLQTLSLMFLCMLMEDFLWFVCNPSYGIHKFFHNQIPWHERRFLKLPPDYFTAIGSSLLATLVAVALSNNVIIIMWWFANIAIFFSLISLCIIIMHFRSPKP
jgi:hypothetical protein